MIDLYLSHDSQRPIGMLSYLSRDSQRPIGMLSYSWSMSVQRQIYKVRRCRDKNTLFKLL